MHSRIIQVSSNVLSVDDYIGKYDYYDHWFTNAIADYVSDTDETQRKAELRAWLADISGLTYNEDAETITIVDKTKYFQYKYEEFMQHIMRLTSTDIDAFVKGSIDMDVQRLIEGHMKIARVLAMATPNRAAVLTNGMNRNIAACITV